MDLAVSVSRIVSRFDAEEIGYALIGGLAMALRGVQRATFDADFLLLLSDMEKTNALLEREGYVRVFHSPNVSHYEKAGAALERIDILHAFRAPSLGMLKRAERMALGPDCRIPVAKIEDLVGLKVQALVNNPARALGDWNDIQRLVEHAGEQGLNLDWELIADYLEIFRMAERLAQLKAIHDEAYRRGKDRTS
jgi:hypothetical protein